MTPWSYMYMLNPSNQDILKGGHLTNQDTLKGGHLTNQDILKGGHLTNRDTLKKGHFNRMMYQYCFWDRKTLQLIFLISGGPHFKSPDFTLRAFLKLFSFTCLFRCLLWSTLGSIEMESSSQRTLPISWPLPS